MFRFNGNRRLGSFLLFLEPDKNYLAVKTFLFFIKEKIINGANIWRPQRVANSRETLDCIV